MGIHGGKNFQTKSMDYSKFESQLGDWAPKFKDFIESKDFDDIYAFLKSESREGKIICPHHENTFRAFRECPFSKLRVVFILQDPYPWVKFDPEKGRIYTSDGMAMSCSNTGVCQPSLEIFYKGMEDDLGVAVPRMPDLSYLANQGILLLNTSLTVEMNKSASHAGIWDKFIQYLLEEIISFYTRGLIYVSFGQNAHIMAKTIIPFLHWGFEVEHPAAAARKERDWKHDKIFTKINKILKDCNYEQINWVYGKLQEEEPSSIKRAVGGKIRKG